MPKEFPLGDGIVQQLSVMEAASFAGKQIGHGDNAACGIWRGRIAVIHDAIGFEGALILGPCAVVLRDCIEVALDCSGASEVDLARMVRTRSLHRRRTKQEYPQAQ